MMTSDNEPEGTSVNFYSDIHSFANRQWAFTVGVAGKLWISEPSQIIYVEKIQMSSVCP